MVEKIKKERVKNKEVVKEMKKAEVRNLKKDKWKIEEELVLKKGKIYVSKNEKLRIEII